MMKLQLTQNFNYCRGLKWSCVSDKITNKKQIEHHQGVVVVQLDILSINAQTRDDDKF